MKNISKLLIISILFFAAAGPLYSKGVHILCYHTFLERKDPYSFAVNQFKDQLVQLKNSGFKFVSFEDIINDRIEGNKNILISIDDGHKTVYQAYFTIMKPMGIKPLLGIYPAIISRQNYAMTWEQVKELSDEGCYIASHGYYHMYLSEKYYKSDPAGFKKEIYHSKKILEEKLNKKIETMVYPFGVYSDIAISELKNAGYKYGMTIIAKMEALPVNNNFQINRYLMTKSAHKGVLARISKQTGNDQISINPEKNKAPIPQNITTDNVQSSIITETSNPLAANNITADNAKETISSDSAEKTEVTPIVPGNMAKKSIIYYPERIKKIISEDVFAEVPNEVKKTDVRSNTNTKFKPFVHSPQLKKNEQKVTEKKNSEKEEGSLADIGSFRFPDFKDRYCSISEKLSSFILEIIDKTQSNIDVVKLKIIGIFNRES